MRSTAKKIQGILSEAEDGATFHILGGNRAVITTPAPVKPNAVGDLELLEGPSSLAYFMNPATSDCLIVCGSLHIHAVRGEWLAG